MRPHHLRHLTRRTLLLSTRCCNPATTLQAPCSAVSAPIVQSRSFMPKLFAPRKAFKPETPPGLEELNALVRHLDQKIGAAPPPDVISRAFKSFVNSFHLRSATEDQVNVLRKSYEHLRRQYPGELPLSLGVLQTALTTLRTGLPDQLALARIFMEDILDIEGYKPSDAELLPYVNALCNAGEVQEAADLCRKYLVNMNQPEVEWKIWAPVLEGFAAKGDEAALLRLVEEVNPLVEQPDRKKRRLYTIMISFYCDKEDLDEVKVWYEMAIAEGLIPTLPIMARILNACMKTGRLDWGNELLQVVLERAEQPISEPHKQPSKKEAWEIVIQFSAGLGKTRDEIEALVRRMTASNVKPDIKTINGLLSIAISQNNAFIHEFALELGSTQNISPDLTHLELRMDWATKAGDLPEALRIFEDLKFTCDIPSFYQAESSQRLLAALAESPSPDVEQVADMYRDLIKWELYFTPATIAALIKLYLSVSSFLDVRHLIKKHVGHFPSSSKNAITQVLVDHCHNPETSIEAVYDTYLILVRALPDCTITQRHSIMKLFFEFGRPEMAVKVLSDMTCTDDRKPTKYQYTSAFLGLARSRDVQQLLRAHRMLNMDPSVEPDTILQNCLMRAYALCGLFQKAWFIYQEISRSPEGPDNATFSIVWDMCGRERKVGLERARIVWEHCRRSKVLLNDNNIASYIECLARHAKFEESWNVVKSYKKDWGMDPGERTIATLFMTYHRDGLEGLEKWLEGVHGKTWAAVRAKLNAPTTPQQENELDDVNPYAEDVALVGRIREKWEMKQEVEETMQSIVSFTERVV